MKLYFDDEHFDGQLQRVVGKCDAGMANVGECLYIASRITPGDRASWFAEWSAFADGLVAQAAAASQAGHATSAAGLRLRAAEYYRQAFFWHRDNLDGQELTTAFRASVDAFRAALPDLPRPGRVVGGDTPGYLFAPAGAGPFPTLLHIGGYANTAERFYMQRGPLLTLAAQSPGAANGQFLNRRHNCPDVSIFIRRSHLCVARVKLSRARYTGRRSTGSTHWLACINPGGPRVS